MANETKKKETAKKAVEKATAAKKATPVKAAPKKAASKPAPKKTTQKVAPKEATPAKVAPKKVASKPAPKKAVQEVAPKEAAPTKAAPAKPKVTAPKEAVKKAPVKAAPAKAAPVKAVKPKSSGANEPLAHGVGRRKASVARVWLRRGKGNVTVNKLSYDRYFDTEVSRQRVRTPFVVYPNTSHYDILVNVVGGGKKAQADAIKLGISRALVQINPEIRPLLRQHGLLTVDSRVVERKKYGQPGARRKFQFVKR